MITVKNRIIFFLNILLITITGIMLITNYLRNRIPSNTFDNLMIIYGVMYSIIVIIVIIIYIKKLI